MLLRVSQDLCKSLCFLLLYHVVTVIASVGDNSYIFQKCAFLCRESNCTQAKAAVFDANQPFHMRLLSWDCIDECGYMCMWKTVDAFQKDGSKIPQFFGKWPFLRIIGLQEPASVLFSILNMVTHIYLLLWFRRRVPSAAPMYWFWHIYALVAINTWIWSSVFHARDIWFTEMMDYFCAISLVIYTAFASFVRILGTSPKWRPIAIGCAFLLFFIYHVYYLAFVHFDYGYNMKANIFIGLVNSAGWLTWCAQHKKKLPYVWKCAVTIISVDLLLLLELGDFPPILWTFDAHSLWHAGTVPILYFWYSFIIEDCLYLLKNQRGELPQQIQENGNRKYKQK